jgi:hypothetical protein
LLLWVETWGYRRVDPTDLFCVITLYLIIHTMLFVQAV